jgi:hypothetical protein
MSPVTRGWRTTLAALACGCVLFAPGAAAAKQKKVTERPVRSEAPDAERVIESIVRIRDPLPDSAGPHPKACDRISYLRFRNAEGPKRAKRADAVITIMPGFLGGASSFDQIARNLVRRADKRGRDVEVWAIDRRANCLEDHHGVKAAARAENAELAYRYYWGGEEVDGRRFAGFVSPSDAEFLESFGLERTMRDWHKVNTTGLRGQRRRERKLICGGHSLGGPLTAAYAGWDFDGDPDTGRDAGYRQCAGLFGLDTTLDIGSSEGGWPGADVVTELVAQSGASPYVNATPLTPETIQLPPIFGVGAFHQPDRTGLNAALPRTPNINLAQRLLFSRDAAHFATGSPDIREFDVTNEVTLAGVFDDNSNPVSILRSSVGSVTGGPLVDKNFPAPDPTLALVEDPDSSTYRWQGYRKVGAGGAPLELNDAGEPYTSRESEVSDLTQLGRAMFEPPADFTEQYFPTRILTDVAAAESGGFEELRHDGVARKPGLLIQAADSDDNSAPDEGPPYLGEDPPNEMELSRELILPGYNHLDVATAAWRQNDGRPEPTSRALAHFSLKAVKAARGR